MSSPSTSLPSLTRTRETRRNTSGRGLLFPKDLPETGKFMFARRRGAHNVQPEEHRSGAPEVREVRLRQGLLRPALPRKLSDPRLRLSEVRPRRGPGRARLG